MGEGIKTRRGQSKGITSTFLYKEGNEFNALTGGWTAYTNGGDTVITKNADNLYIHGGTQLASQYGAFISNNSIDLTKYTKLCYRVGNSGVSTSETYYIFALGVATAKQNVHNPTYAASWQINAAISIDGIHSIDIKEINSGYIHVHADVTRFLNIYEVWLE